MTLNSCKTSVDYLQNIFYFRKLKELSQKKSYLFLCFGRRQEKKKDFFPLFCCLMSFIVLGAFFLALTPTPHFLKELIEWSVRAIKISSPSVATTQLSYLWKRRRPKTWKRLLGNDKRIPNKKGVSDSPFHVLKWYPVKHHIWSPNNEILKKPKMQKKKKKKRFLLAKF